MLLTVLKEAFTRNVLIVFGVTFLVVLPYQLQHVKHSVYYRSPYNESLALSEHKHENNVRLKVSRTFFNELNENNMRKVEKGLEYDVVISIITTSRNRNTADGYKPHYLTQVTGAFLKLMRKMDKQAGFQVMLLICNVDSNPTFYEEAKYMNQFVQVFNRFNKTHLSILHILEKEKQDYVFCLNNSFSKFHARYHFLVEDDALPKENTLEVLQFTIRMHLDVQYQRGLILPESEVLYVKFYHPERLLTYFTMDPARLCELFGLSLTMASVLVLILQKLTRSAQLCKLWIICTCYCTLLLLTIGRVNVSEFRQYFSPYLHTYSLSPSCCTPALLFPNRTIQTVIKHLSENTCSRNIGKDSLLDQLVMQSKAKAYIVEPNSFGHIGMYSALRSTVVHSSFV